MAGVQEVTGVKTAAFEKPCMIELPLPAIRGLLCPYIPSGSAPLRTEGLLARCWLISRKECGLCLLYLGSGQGCALPACLLCLLGVSFSSRACPGHFAPHSVLQGDRCFSDVIFFTSIVCSGGRKITLSVIQLS